MKDIQDSVKEIQGNVYVCQEGLERLDGEYKDYLLEIGVCFNGIRDWVKGVQDEWMNRAKSQYNCAIEKYNKVIQ